MNILADVIDTYHNVTGVSTLFLDASLEIKYISKGIGFIQLKALGFDEVLSFVNSRIEENNQNQDSFYTYYCSNNCIYNLVFMQYKKEAYGVFVCGPMILPTKQSKQLHSLIQDNNYYLERKSLLETLSRISIVSEIRINNLGKMLVSCVQSYNSQKIYQQIHKMNGDEKTSTKHDLDRGYPFITLEEIDESQFLPQEYYNVFKQVVSTGDVQGMDELIASFSKLPLDKIIPINSIEALRTFSIAATASCFCFAIEAGAPYYQMSELNSSFLRLASEQRNQHEIVNLMGKILTTFTQAVAIYSYQSYSKPVKLAMKYIRKNIHEKITLKELAEYTGFSSFYLSTLIKKETGNSLTDNINAIRLEESKYLLMNTSMSIMEIAQSVGYNYQNHYASLFKKMVGVTPTEFRSRS